MTSEESKETERVALRELLLDTAALPAESVREAIFERTFAAGQEPGGTDLIPPPELFGGGAETPEPLAADPDDPDDPGDVGIDGSHLIDDAGDAWFTNGPPLELPTPEGTVGLDGDPGSSW
ncbi:MAG: hypothetical protein ACT4NY_28010 [Pseudonocardiales bacterium]